jgi:4'-phosphopantetheinyl transferase EntD
MQRSIRALNPAVRSRLVEALFPVAVVAAELAETASAQLLTEAEFACISHCYEKRIEQFASGRACAHRALEELGWEEFSLLPAPDRQPVWPDGVTGSITHTEGYCAAVAARRGALRGLGLDSEEVARVHAEVWPGITAPQELTALQSLPPSEAQQQAALLFAAKEAFYKSQFPLTAEWLKFADVVIECTALPTAHSPGSFRVLPQRDMRITRELPGTIAGRFCLHGRYLTAALALVA